MKRVLVIPLLLIYMLAVSGVMVQLHYCGKTLESWAVYQQSKGCEDTECDDDNTTTHNCCKDKLVAAKVSQDQHHSDVFKLKLTGFTFPVHLFPDPVSVPTQNNSIFYSFDHLPNAPPGSWQNIPLYKLHGQFTYYG